MFIAHPPASFPVTERLAAALPPRRRRAALALGLAAGIAPDTDLHRFYRVDGRAPHHHLYATHPPAFWPALGALAMLLARRARAPEAIPFIGIALANVLLHLALDSMTGRIRWLRPLPDAAPSLLTVPPGHAWRGWNFILHWSFAAELAILAAAPLRLRQRVRPVATASAQSSRPAARAAATMRAGS